MGNFTGHQGSGNTKPGTMELPDLMPNMSQEPNTVNSKQALINQREVSSTGQSQYNGRDDGGFAVDHM
jgi:hypothetical protein